MGPVRQNPTQRTVSLFICVCIALCTIVAHNIAQNRPDSFPPYPPDNHHISDDVCLREGGKCVSQHAPNHVRVQSYHNDIQTERVFIILTKQNINANANTSHNFMSARIPTIRTFQHHFNNKNIQPGKICSIYDNLYSPIVGSSRRNKPLN